MPGIPSLPGVGGGSVTYKSLQSKYQDFAYPQAEILLGGAPFKDKTKQMILSDINVELTCGFEASIARFRIYNAYDAASGTFQHSAIKKQVVLGAALTIRLGYFDELSTVFTGFVAEVSFGFDAVELPYIEVTGMDVKGIMMASSYAKQLLARSYGDAVREVLQKTAYTQLQGSEAITSIQVTDTPDKKPSSGESAETIEMVSESDYEFVVKAAKKFNYEFFSDRGVVYFRRAKSNPAPLMQLEHGGGITKFLISYSLSGMVETVEARAMDPGAGKVISAKNKYGGTLSVASKAKGLIKQSQRVYIDPTISSLEDATARAASLMEDVSYRLGALECECPGMPELVPGRFVEVAGFGAPVDNTFYLTSVIHDFGSETGYSTRLIGKASSVKKSLGI